MLGAEGDGGWGGRRGVCSQLQEGKNCISFVDTSADCFLLHKHTHPLSHPPHTHPVFFSVTHLHIRTPQGHLIVSAGAGLVRRGPLLGQMEAKA